MAVLMIYRFDDSVTVTDVAKRTWLTLFAEIRTVFDNRANREVSPLTDDNLGNLK